MPAFFFAALHSSADIPDGLTRTIPEYAALAGHDHAKVEIGGKRQDVLLDLMRHHLIRLPTPSCVDAI